MKRAILLLAIPAALSACDRPPHDRGQSDRNPTTSCEELSPHSAAIDCKFDLAKKSRAKVDALYKEYFETAGKLDEVYEQAFQNDRDRADKNFYAHHVENAQKAWISYVEIQCRLEGETHFGGSGGWDAEAECQDRLNLESVDELKAALKLTRFPLENYKR